MGMSYFLNMLAYRIKAFRAQDNGVVALVFALCVPMFVGAAGIAVDLAQAYNVKSRLGNALDKAALAAGSTTGTAEQVEAQVLAFFEANYPEQSLGTAYDVTVALQDNVVNVTARARVDTTFMKLLGYDYLDIVEESEVVRELAGVEVVLVLDVTGSMSGSKLTALKNAVCNASSTSSCRTKSFIRIMFERIAEPEYLKIGIVPFSQSVNVGPYGLGLDHDGSAYGNAFVDQPATDTYKNPATITYSSSGSNNNWTGCIIERSYPLDTTDASNPNWGMYRYPRICGSYNWDGSCRSYSNNNPNNGCTTSRVVPLTNNESTLKSAIYNLTAAGNTYGNVGMVWGYHVITPSEPFTEGAAMDDHEWSKTVVMMTDGDNVSGTMSAYGYQSSPSANTLDSRFLETCTNMKADGITIYTIAFDGGSGISNDTKQMLQSCSGADKYYNAGTDDIGAAFEDIANHLSQLHITK